MFTHLFRANAESRHTIRQLFFSGGIVVAILLIAFLWYYRSIHQDTETKLSYFLPQKWTTSQVQSLTGIPIWKGI